MLRAVQQRRGEVAFEKRSEQAKYRTLSCPRPSTSKPILSYNTYVSWQDDKHDALLIDRAAVDTMLTPAAAGGPGDSRGRRGGGADRR